MNVWTWLLSIVAALYFTIGAGGAFIMVKGSSTPQVAIGSAAITFFAWPYVIWKAWHSQFEIKRHT